MQNKPRVIFQCTQRLADGRMINLPDLQMVMRPTRVEGDIPIPGVSRFLKANAAGQYVIAEDDEDYDQMLALMKKYFVKKYGLIQVGAEQEGKLPAVEAETDKSAKKLEAVLEKTLALAAQKDDAISRLSAENADLKDKLGKFLQKVK